MVAIVMAAGYGWGPWICGYLSTILEPSLGNESLRYSLLIYSGLLLIASASLLAAANTLREEYARAIDA